jgi:hydroxyquinol 1,2-dioxygenase
VREFDEKSITQAVVGRKWLAAIQFLTNVGKTCTPKRQEFILLSDTTGVSVLVITLNHPADQNSVESTVLGPFYWQGAPDLPRGSNLAEGVKGEPTIFSGRVLRMMARHPFRPATRT